MSNTQPDIDRLYMSAAYALAERGLYSVTRNNPRVGCLIVNDGVVIGRGWHQQDGGPHAEVNALRAVQDSALTAGATVYVSLEPCCWEGRTQACTQTLVEANIARVVVGQLDPHPKVSGQGLAQLKDCGVQVQVCPLPELVGLNPGQWSRVKYNRPWIRIKSAVSIDGRTAMSTGESQWITGTAARRDVQAWRARSSAILTGIGTILKDDPRLTVRDERYLASKPLRVVCDSKARIPSNAQITQPDAALMIATCDGQQPTFEASHIEWSQHGKETVDLASLFHKLADTGVNEVLVEAGSTLTGELFRRGLWDEWLVYTAPKLMGSATFAVAEFRIEELADAVEGRFKSVTAIGDDLRFLIERKSP